MRRRVLIYLCVALLAMAFVSAAATGATASSVSVTKKTIAAARASSLKARVAEIQSNMRHHRITLDQRMASAALHAAWAKLGLSTPSGKMGALAVPGTSGKVSALAVPTPGGTPNYFGPERNWLNSPPLHKFVDSLPGLGVGKKNNLNQYIPISVADTTTYPGSDYYEISVGEYEEQMHTDLKPTKLRGYRQTNMGGTPYSYLGPIIIATKDRPVRIKFTNNLPTGAGGNLFLPVDTTVMGAGMGPLGMGTTLGWPMNYTQNRATLHLHGGLTPWISDGTMHQWITPAGEQTDYPKGVSVKNVPDMPDPGPGSQTFYYTNQQSARLMFYHDHSYGITRLNVYAGEAAPYLLTDQTEQDLITAGVLPDFGTPLVIQDKTFISNATSITAEDPTWPFSVEATRNDLWYPHVYMPNQNTNAMDGMNPMGRWDYGPWFWPPWPVTNPPISLPDGTLVPNVPNLSITPEAFHDTPVINGTAYPYLTVDPKAYRFRILNAADDRFWNLGLYVADPLAPTEIATVTAAIGARYANGTLVNFPLSWQAKTTGQPADILDGRDSGVPDPALIGPPFIQIGTEGGFLPAPVVIDSTPIGFDRDPKSVTVGNVKEHGLWLGPAERADVIVDFSAYQGKTIILYNDSPAPVPATDSRDDYYTGDVDQTDVGGAPTTQAGFGPNTRTIMQIRVSNNATSAYDLTALQNAFASTATTQGVFAKSQDPVLVPQADYNTAYNGTFPTGVTAYERIQSTSLGFNPLDTSTATKLSSTMVTITNEPKAIQELFSNDYGRMEAYLGLELPFTNGFNQTTIDYGVVDPPTEILSDNVTVSPVTAGDGTQLWKVTHNGVDTHAIHFHLFNVQVINRVGWDGSIRPPDPQELGWKETVRMNPLEDCIVALRPVAPKQPFGLPDSVRPYDPTMPLGSTTEFRGIDPNGNPITVTNVETNFGWEYVWHCHILGHEEADMMRPIVFNVGRSLPAVPVLSALLSGNVQLTWTDATPPTLASTFGNLSNEIGFRIEKAPVTNKVGAYSVAGYALANQTTFSDPYAGGTWSYRVVAFNAAGESVSLPVQVASGTVAPAAPNNLTAVLQTGPQVMLSFRDNATNESSFSVERQLNGGGFAQIVVLPPHTNTGTVSYSDSTVVAQPGAVYAYRVKAVNSGGSSAYSNIALVTFPSLPAMPTLTSVTAVPQGGTSARVTPSWTNVTGETGYIVERATDSGFLNNVVDTTVGANVTSLAQSGLSQNQTYWYRIRSFNISGNSAWSNAISVTTAPPPPPSLVSLTAVIAGTNDNVTITWTNVTGEQSYTLQRAKDSLFTNSINTVTGIAANTTSRTQTVTRNTTFWYHVRAVNAFGNSAWSNSMSILTP